MTTSAVKTIDLKAKEWFDRVNGNSYFSAQATINFGMADERTIYIPFQYGYGEHYHSVAAHQLQTDGILPNDQTIYSFTRWCRENNIILRYSKEENCRQRDVKAFGSN
jgi:hypothetical protein